RRGRSDRFFRRRRGKPEEQQRQAGTDAAGNQQPPPAFGESLRWRAAWHQGWRRMGGHRGGRPNGRPVTHDRRVSRLPCAPTELVRRLAQEFRDERLLTWALPARCPLADGWTAVPPASPCVATARAARRPQSIGKPPPATVPRSATNAGLRYRTARANHPADERISAQRLRRRGRAHRVPLPRTGRARRPAAPGARPLLRRPADR